MTTARDKAIGQLIALGRIEFASARAFKLHGLITLATSLDTLTKLAKAITLDEAEAILTDVLTTPMLPLVGPARLPGGTGAIPTPPADKCLFAYTAAGTTYPEYISVTLIGGQVKVTVRSPPSPHPTRMYDVCGATAEMTLPAEVIAELARQLAEQVALAARPVQRNNFWADVFAEPRS